MSDLNMNRAERNSTATAKIREYMEARLAEHRANNDYFQSPDHTAMLRGRIAEAKALIELLAEQD